MKQNLHSSVWKCCVLFLIALSTQQSSSGQAYGETSSSWEIGITVGPSNFLGDLGGNAGKGTTFLKDNNFPMTKLMYGAYVTYQPSEWLGFRLAANFGTLEGDDAIIKGKGGYEEARKLRNSDFKSKIQEAMLMAEIYPTVFLEYEPSDVWAKLRPYVGAGVGVFKFNPKGHDPVTNQWVELKPLRTEGQGFPEYPDRKEYKLTQLNVPLAIGVKYFLSESVNLSLEILHRVTFTDYIDDVSTRYIDPALFYAHMPLNQARLAQRMANKSLHGIFKPGQKRGTETNNDAYYSVGFKLGIRLGKGDPYRMSTRCPIRY